MWQWGCELHNMKQPKWTLQKGQVKWAEWVKQTRFHTHTYGIDFKTQRSFSTMEIHMT
jgi:hypothetical protein